MGILDDLKNQSEVLKAGEEKEKQRQAELLEYYQQNLHPKMLQLYRFLTELTEHLNYINPDTITTYPFNPDGGMLTLRQQDYKVTIDSANEVKEINLRFYCHLPEPMLYELENKERIERYAAVLESYRLPFERKDYKNSNYELISAKFKLTGPLPVNIILRGDIENSAIHLLLNNFEKPGTDKHSFKDRHITDEFMDSFGKYIIRQSSEFLKLEIAEEHREIIRQNIQADMNQRQQELDAAEQLEPEDEKQSSWTKLFNK